MDEIHVHKTKKSICAHFAESPCRKQKVNQLQKQLNSQRFIFQNMRSDNEKVLRSFLIAHRIAKKVKAYFNVDFVKKCSIDVAQEICQNDVGNPENKSVVMDSGKAYECTC